MIQSVIFQLKRRLPLVSIVLVASCMISTLPQFFLSDVYSQITGQLATYNTYYLFTLNAFTHSPGMLVTHLTGNLLVFIVFGVIVELVIGSRRFALITLTTFLSTTLIRYLYTEGVHIAHGASGIAWGYHSFYIFILILLFRYQGKKALKDIFLIFTIFLALFDVFGIPVVEVVVQKRALFENFGQVLHLVSMIVVVPLIFLWRKDIEANTKQLISGEPVGHGNNYKNIATGFIIAMALFNIFGTYKAIELTHENNRIIVNSISPRLDTKIADIPQKIVVEFDEKIEDIPSKRSISTTYSELEKLTITEHLTDPNTLEIHFNRRFTEGEKIKLTYTVLYKNEQDIYIPYKLILDYQ